MSNLVAPDAPAEAPTATYRLQLTPDFTLDDACGVLDHLVVIGASHVYLSPVLAAVPGSLHGYDVVDHGRVADHLGGDDAFLRFTDAAAAAGLRVVVDVVPNHFSIEGDHNPRWLDVLEHGPSSESAAWFDIDWTGREEHQRGTVVLPVLGDLYGELLAAGDLVLARSGSRFEVHCPGHRFPLAPRSLPLILWPAADALQHRFGDEPAVARLRFVADVLTSLTAATTPAERRRRREHLDVLRELLTSLVEHHEVTRSLDDVLRDVNADPAAVHRVLEGQHYRLTYWRAGAKELDYRRFFDVTTLAAIRVEQPEVFAAVHELPRRWLAEGRVHGLRIDHPDGLADPKAYFESLRATAPDAWIVAEKILAGDEQLPTDWPIDGTTGYDGLRSVFGLLVDPNGAAGLDEAERVAHELCGTNPPEATELIRASKHDAVSVLLAADLERVVDLAVRITERRPLHRDHPRPDLRRAITALAVELDVYRTYAVPPRNDEPGHVSADDRARIGAAAHRAIAADDELDPRLVRFLAGLVALRADSEDPSWGDDEAEFVVRFQQLTGPATAKGLEDTAWYRLARFVAANEVGGDPLRPAVSLDAFHESCRERQRRWPLTMTTLSTHDTKRSADVRARLAVLSEPGLEPTWPAVAARWFPRLLEIWPGDIEPHAPTLLLALQTMIGAWPIHRDRLEPYLVKAAREAEERTTWTRVDEGFERALATIAALVDDPSFAEGFAADTAEIRRSGWHNSLVQTAIGLLQPGVPDIYQGTETGELSLVDPDNRRPVDFDRLAALLGERGSEVEADDPTTKIALVAASLGLRRRRPEAFGAGPDGAHHQLEVAGSDHDRVVAFQRGDAACLVATRFPTRGPLDPDTTVALPDGRWEPAFGGRPTDGGEIAVGDLTGALPVAVLERR